MVLGSSLHTLIKGDFQEAPGLLGVQTQLIPICGLLLGSAGKQWLPQGYLLLILGCSTLAGAAVSSRGSPLSIIRGLQLS